MKEFCLIKQTFIDILSGERNSYKKKAVLFFALLSLTMLAGCAKDPTKENASKTASTPYATAQPTEQADGSTLTVSETDNGIKSEVRFFPKGDVAQVSRATWPDGRRAVAVIFRDGTTVALQERADIDQAIEASNEAIAAIAKKAMAVGGSAKTAPVTTPEDVAKAQGEKKTDEKAKPEAGKPKTVVTPPDQKP
jgi:hypothetical protein